MDETIKMLAIILATRLPAILKQLRKWHLGYLNTTKDNQDN